VENGRRSCHARGRRHVPATTSPSRRPPAATVLILGILLRDPHPVIPSLAATGARDWDQVGVLAWRVINAGRPRATGFSSPLSSSSPNPRAGKGGEEEGRRGSKTEPPGSGRGRPRRPLKSQILPPPSRPPVPNQRAVLAAAAASSEVRRFLHPALL